MTYPWEKPKLDYQDFMDRHVRVIVIIDGERKGSFAIVDDGSNMNAETMMPNGSPLIFKVEGHPRTTDPRMTAAELINYVLTHY